ncbi:2'-5' RNA ligase family protein [Gloeocapsopsis dulcis]|uniref:2'-5' RNA ligase n=1 Tax=Gloeocapsopsis dulcis AAB1 = 1H9 TaxID=1433147 RepID=A0A6N8G1A0_9CHRO|nr:2'-5' RNA ligase family protein [Gloeocapsopsis dulcis]MUL37936.1 2'-5' RNA ligase [Gloeocapsopsis dulcis AAB1 = 1H9]WNN87332.1 2'-5' RNA ligase family protein [Gloeocapsopsis dulcis]
MAQITNRYFIALLPPLEIQTFVRDIQQHFAESYSSRGALRSPPHITLQPPFFWTDDIKRLENHLNNFAQGRSPIPIALDGFGAFSPRVIYVDVRKSLELLELQAGLMAQCELVGIIDPVSKTRPFAPHMTVAFRDLTRQNFKAAWAQFQQQQLYFEFTATDLTLLLHKGKQWNIHAIFPFAANN